MDEKILDMLKNQQVMLKSLVNKLNKLEMNFALIQEHYRVLGTSMAILDKRLARCPPNCPFLLNDNKEVVKMIEEDITPAVDLVKEKVG